MEWQITPYQSVGSLNFNLKRSSIRQQFDEPLEVEVVIDAKPPVDVFLSQGLHVVYDKFSNCGAFEIKAPGKAIFQDKDLLKMPYEEALNWFNSLDQALEESEEQFVSWKYGILFYAPDKTQNPQTLADTITVFRKDFFDIKNGIPDPAVINSFHIHAAFVEPVEQAESTFDNLTTALQTIFKNNKEEGFLIWNGVPLAFSYSNDLPVLIEQWTEMVEAIQKEVTGKQEVALECPAFAAKWNLKWNDKFILIKSHWTKTGGNYEEALNAENINELTLLKKDFLAEWKMLFKQCKQGLKIAKARVEDPLVDRLYNNENQLTVFGKFYKDNEKVITVNADGRKQVDFSKLSLLGQGIIVLAVLTFVLVPVWLLSKDKDSVFWFWENIPQILLYLSPFLLIIVYVAIKIFRVRSSMKH